MLWICQRFSNQWHRYNYCLTTVLQCSHQIPLATKQYMKYSPWRWWWTSFNENGLWNERNGVVSAIAISRYQKSVAFCFAFISGWSGSDLTFQNKSKCLSILFAFILRHHTQIDSMVHFSSSTVCGENIALSHHGIA